MPKLDVIGFGAMNVDYLYRVGQVVIDGEDSVEEFTALPGGSAANTIYALAKLGVKTGFIGIVGDDENGNLLLKDFKAAGIDASQVRIEKGKETGSVLCLSDKLGSRSLYVSPGANSLLKQSQVDLNYVNQAQIMHFSSFVNEEQFKIQVSLAKEKTDSVRITLAPGMLYAKKGLGTLAPLLQRTHILFLNREEIELLTGKNFRDGAEECIRYGSQIMVVTLGKGLALEKNKVITSYIFDGKQMYQTESKSGESSPLLETTGAGDAFAAGFLLGILKGKGLRECGILGDLMARFAITKPGARQGLPDLHQLSESYFRYCGEKL